MFIIQQVEQEIDNEEGSDYVGTSDDEDPIGMDSSRTFMETTLSWRVVVNKTGGIKASDSLQLVS